MQDEKIYYVRYNNDYPGFGKDGLAERGARLSLTARLEATP